MKEFGITLNFRDKMITIDETILSMRDINKLKGASMLKVLQHNHSLAMEPQSTQDATDRAMQILDANYKKSRPIKKVIKNINQLYKNNYFIIIFTSRFMGRNNDNIEHAYNDGYEFTKRQLMNWGVNFHRLIFGKPSYDLYVDDKSIFFRRDWIKLLNKKINK